MPEDRDIPYLAFESVCARFERTIKRLWILVVLLTILLVGTNCAWLWYTSQLEEVTTTEVSQDVETDNDGNVVVSGTGDIDYGNED